jgi:hypothetical protein
MGNAYYRRAQVMEITAPLTECQWPVLRPEFRKVGDPQGQNGGAGIAGNYTREVAVIYDGNLSRRSTCSTEVPKGWIYM